MRRHLHNMRDPLQIKYRVTCPPRPRGAQHDKNTLSDQAPICLLPVDSHRGTAVLFVRVCVCILRTVERGCSTQWMCGDGLKAYRFTLEPKPKRAELRLLRGAANQPELTPLVLAQWKLKSNCINPVKENIVGNHCVCVCVCACLRFCRRVWRGD